MSKTHDIDEPTGFVEDQRAFFDRLITQDWETYLNPLWDYTRAFEVEQIFRRVASVQRILDVGCGCGYHDVLMAERPGVTAVVGIDYSAKSIEMADRQYPHPHVTRWVADVFAPDIDRLTPGSFDLATSFQVIEHVIDACAFLTACARWVRPGGWMVIVTPNRQRLANRVRALWGREPLLIDPMHFREYTAPELAELGRQVGLTYTGHFAYGLTLPAAGRIDLNVLLPKRIALRLGQRMPAAADGLGIFFRVGDPSSITGEAG